ncbi:MAG: AAA family ATPase [Chloroflexota bacterium]
MLNVCYKCGMYRADKEIVKDEGSANQAWAVCPECGHHHQFNYFPMMFVCGPSSAGKSTVCQSLTVNYDKAVLLDGDILWRNEFASEENGGAKGFFDTWLRVAKNVGMSGRPVVVFNAGAIPDNVVENVEARYFSSIHFLAMVCDDDELERRLKARPEWRGTYDSEFIKEQQRFSNWLKGNAQTNGRNINLIDTSAITEEESIEEVESWIDQIIG